MSSVFSAAPLSPRSHSTSVRRRRSKPSSSSGGSTSSLTGMGFDLSPEKTLVEFISTSASFFRVRRKNLSTLEDEITRVSVNNIMPANAAAWYLAKRKFYVRNPPEYQLLPFLLRNHPDKFRIKGETVEFLEIYDKEVAHKKLRDLNHLGLIAYFTHKVEEYGVYLFDPLYYERTEPFYSGLKAATGAKKSARFDLLPAFFKNISQLHLEKVNPYLLSLSSGSEPIEVRSNVVGIVVKMLDKNHGLLQFGTLDGTAKAIFSTKALFKDGYHYKTGDPLILPAMEFDGYRLPRRICGAGDSALEFTWCAVLVWHGKKPSPKYNATWNDLLGNYTFGNKSNSPIGGSNTAFMGSSLPSMESRERSRGNVFNPIAHQPIVNDCMQIGEVVKIRHTGAYVSLSKDQHGQKAFIPGWLTRSNGKSFLTTVQTVVLFVGDLVGYYLDASQKAPTGAVAVGFNIIVLKRKEELKGKKLSKKDSDSKVVAKKTKKIRNNSAADKDEFDGRASSSGDEGGRYVKTNKNRIRSTSETEDGNGKSKPYVKSYVRYLLMDPISDSESIHSNKDPAYNGAAYFDADYDFDEYTDGEIDEEELVALEKENLEDLDVEELKRLMQEDEEKRAQELKEAAEKLAIEKKAEKLKREEERKAEKEKRLIAKATKSSVDVEKESSESSSVVISPQTLEESSESSKIPEDTQKENLS